MAQQIIQHLVSLRPVEGLSISCDEYLVGLLERIRSQKMTAQDKEVLYYSGRNFNEMGYYEDCIRKPHMTYTMIQIGIEYLRNPIGICMVDKCSAKDWDFLHQAALTALNKVLDDPTSKIHMAKDYFVLLLDHVYPADHPGLKDSYAFFFVVFVGIVLSLVLYSTFHFFIKSKQRGPKTLEAHIEEEDIRINQYEDRRKSLIARSILRFFDLQTNIKDAGRYILNHPGQLTVDFIHIIYSIFIFLYLVPFVEASISRIAQDSVENAYYNSGPADSNLQIMLFLPEGFLFLSGYVCTLSAVRAFSRVDIGLRKQHWWRLGLCYFQQLLRRYLRLVFGFVLGSLFLWKIFPIIMTGPLRYTQLGCTDDNFFPSLLFLNNQFVGNNRRMCSSWYYFFAMNFRMFTILPGLVLIFLFGYRKVAGGIAAALGIVSLVYETIYIHHKGIRETHPYDGRWLAEVFSNTYMHCFSYFFGVICCFLQLTYIDQFVSKFSARNSDLYLDVDSGHDLGSLANTVGKEPEGKQKRRIRYNRFWEIVFLVNLLLFSVDYYLYSQYWQNDDFTIKNWPQWRHTVFNTAGIIGIGLCPIFILAGIFFRIDQPILKFFSNSTVFGLLRSSYYELNILGVPYLIVLFVALQTMPYFDEPMVNSSIPWITLSAVVISVVLNLLLFKPLDDLASKAIGL